MAGNADFINILRDIRGSAAPGQPATDGIWYELTIADKNGNPGIYGDILAKYGVVTESAGTFDQAVAILENLNVEVTTLPAGSQATSALVNGVWQIGIPRGTAGINGTDGFTPVVGLNYSLGNLNYTVTVDGVQITNAALVNLDWLVDTRVNANVDVQTTLAAKQDVLNAVSTAQAIADGLNVNVANKIVQLDAHTTIKVGELNVASAAEQLELAATADAKKLEYYQNAVVKTAQYDANHTTKLNEYNANDALKIEQYNANHLERLENLDTQYADRIVDMLNTNKILGMVDKFAAKTPTEYATFIDTTNGNYLYYLNGVLLTEFVGYAVTNNTTIHLTNPIAYGDVVTQVDSRYVGDYLKNEGVILEERIGQPNGVAGLDSNGLVPSTQLPSYVDDVIEVPTQAALPAVGELGKIYVVVADETSGGDTSSYRWAGSAYAMISNSLTAADIKALYESVANKVLTSVDSLQFSGGTGTQGTISWNADEETVDLIQNGAVLQLGQEVQTHVRNTTASTISSGKVVMVTGTIGASGRITVGLYDGVSEVKYILGVCTEDIAAGDDGKVTHFGKVRGVNTSTWNEGDLLYPTTNGDLTNAAPTSGVKLALAIVITKHATNGTIMVWANGVDELAYEPKNVNIQTHIASTSNPHSVTKAQVGLSNVDNTSDADKPISIAMQTALDAKIDDTEKGAPLGLATLDANGKVTLSQINDSILGQLEYMGVWDFATMPTAIEKGQYWVAAIAGNGYEVGDWAVYNGSTFDKVDNTDAVSSVAGRTGVVTLTKSDVGLSNVDNTSDATKNVLSATKLTTARAIQLSGAVTGTADFDGSAAINIVTTHTADPVITLAGDATGSVTLTNLGSGTLTVSVVDDSHNHIVDNVDGLRAELDAKAPLTSPSLIGVPTAPTAAVGTSTTQLATTAFVNAEIANDTYSKTQLNAGQLDNRYYTETELNSGVLDTRYYTEAEIDTKLAAQNDASEIVVVPTGNLASTNVQAALVELQADIDNRYTKSETDTLLAGKVDDSEIASVNLLRADKYLAAQNVVNMEYNVEGKLAKVQYNNAIDENYEVLTYNGEGKLSNVAHYVGGVLQGNTVLSYSNGKLVSAPYTAI